MLQAGDWKTLPREPDQPKRKDLETWMMGVPQLKPLPRNTPESSSSLTSPTHKQPSGLLFLSPGDRQTSPDISESQKEQEEGPKTQRLSRTQHSHPQSPKKKKHEETLLFSRKKRLYKKKVLLEMSTMVAEMKASSTTEAEQ